MNIGDKKVKQSALVSSPHNRILSGFSSSKEALFHFPVCRSGVETFGNVWKTRLLRFDILCCFFRLVYGTYTIFLGHPRVTRRPSRLNKSSNSTPNRERTPMLHFVDVVERIAIARRRHQPCSGGGL